MNARDEWLKSRRQGLGGSDISAILGVNPWKSAVDVYLDKTGQTPDTDPNEAMYWGTVLEDVVARHYAETNAAKVQRINQIMRHPQHNWMIGNIDRAIVTPGSRARIVDGSSRLLAGADGLLECKTASAYKAGDWGRPDDEEAVPTQYVAQCMWYMAITGLDWCDIAVLIGGQKYLDKRIERDDETIRGMIERAEEFWFKHVVEGIAPEPKTGDDALKLFPQDSGRIIEANPKTLELIGRAQELKMQIKAIEEELEGDKNKCTAGVLGSIKAFMGDASAIAIGDDTLITWKAAKGSSKTDYAAVIAALRETYKGEETMLRDISNAITANTTTVAGSRRFIIK